MRDVSFNSVNSFVAILKQKLTTWLQQYSKAAQEYSLDTPLYGLIVKVKKTRKALPPITKLDRLFEKISAKLPIALHL